LVSSGTGGHLLPAVMLAQAMRDAGQDTILLTEGRRTEQVLLERYPCRAEALPVGRGGVGLPVRFAAAVLRARRLLKREGVDLVVGSGGRTSVPVGIAARSLGVPVVLMEQNAVPGRANRFLLPLARRIYLGLPSRRRPRRSLLTGTPLRPEMGRIDRADARRSLGLSLDQPVILVTGGSQGAKVLNEVVPDALCQIPRALQVLHLCGAGADENVRLRYAAGAEEHGTTALVRSHAFDMATYYAAADLVICRGGGGTVAELAAAGRASIIVPYPHHRDRQQFWNGKVLEDAGGAVVVEQHTVTATSLAALVESLFRWDRLGVMGDMARSLAPRDSCERILADLASLTS
jgi:UDP-N-acetylglucosamine--N-acetylmuramyl-(pentapeptide) pyrophosphoryl-undecaprenol N-acetylglucosamine transferase